MPQTPITYTCPELARALLALASADAPDVALPSAVFRLASADAPDVALPSAVFRLVAPPRTTGEHPDGSGSHPAGERL
ncbi:hypothetical protein [Actinotalea sp. JY-7876]|uniref:hypothetical protein n=1 Tax=Actinotalea sp. JY-7876 TaxID=2758442 RepID=UPI0015F6ACAD|nr:hypothetical protein [Actinotalea sp. JY-7876]